MPEGKMIWTENQAEALGFRANLCVLAGAGSGKTMTLVELILRLIEGRIEGFERPAGINRILALTYTEKAAREMRDRVRREMNKRIKQAPDRENAEFWIKQRRMLDRAQISTIHGFCHQVLRQYGFDAGLDPDFHVLDESSDFQAEALKGAMVDLLAEGDEDLTFLMDFFPWKAIGRGQGLDSLAREINQKARTFGRPVSPAQARPISLAESRAALAAAADLADDFIASGQVPRDKSHYRPISGFVSEARRILGADLDEAEFLDLAASLQSQLKGNWYKAKSAKDEARKVLDELGNERARRLLEPVKRKLADLAEKIESRVEAAKLKRLALDFDDLLLAARRLLAERPQVRAELKKRFEVILVDEFQDTNRLQADIIAYLTEPGGGPAWPADHPASDSLPRDPRRLVVFGDPKQSIYRFRGAEVSVFNRLQNSILEKADQSSGILIPLNKNFRSQQHLVDFYNEFFSQVMKDGKEFDARFGLNDRQIHHRASLYQAPGVVLLETPDEGPAQTRREAEARAMAQYINKILTGEIRIAVGDPARPPGPGDAAVLLRRFTHLKIYEDAFRDAGLDFHTVRGKGFFQCQEVLDLASLLFFLADPQQEQALLGLLRSPLFGLEDETLVRMVWPEEKGSPKKLTEYFTIPRPAASKNLNPDQAALLEEAMRLLPMLAAEAGRAFPAELIEKAVEETDYLAVLLAQPQGEQKAANAQRFIEVSRDMPLEALYGPGEIAAFLRARLNEGREDPEAQITAEGAEAIQIMTIHQAKGLEFPIVFVPDAGTSPRPERGPVAFGDDDFFALRAREPERKVNLVPNDFEQFKKQNENREMAEYKRLLYVSATRARDHLVFSGSREKKKDCTSWLFLLDEFATKRPDLIRKARIESEPEESCLEATDQGPTSSGSTACPGRVQVALDPSIGDRISKILDRPRPLPQKISLSVTGLAQFFACPRLFYLETLSGLPNRTLPTNEDGGWEGGGGMDPRERGNIFHRAMETLDLAARPGVSDLRREVAQAGRHYGLEIGAADTEEIARALDGFVSSPLGRDMYAAGDRLVWREKEFLIKIEGLGRAPDLLLTGEIDLFYIRPDGLARLIDYKFASPESAPKYQPQLKTYALALVRAGLGTELEAGLYFAGQGDGSFVKTPLETGWVESFEEDLRRAAARMGRLEAHGLDALERYECPNLDCGWKYACDLSPRSAAEGRLKIISCRPRKPPPLP